MLPSAACGVAPRQRQPGDRRATASPTSGTAPLAVTFTAAATDADGDTLTYTWDLNGDGTFETTGQNPTFSYTTAGTYTPVVKVTDAKGGSATKTLAAITVTAAPSNSDDVPGGDLRHVPTRALAHAGRPPANLGTFIPGVAKDYTATLNATVTSTASAAALTVRDPSTTAPGRLVNGSLALTQPVQMKVGQQRVRAR